MRMTYCYGFKIDSNTRLWNNFRQMTMNLVEKGRGHFSIAKKKITRVKEYGRGSEEGVREG